MRSNKSSENTQTSQLPEINFSPSHISCDAEGGSYEENLKKILETKKSEEPEEIKSDPLSDPKITLFGIEELNDSRLCVSGDNDCLQAIDSSADGGAEEYAKKAIKYLLEPPEEQKADTTKPKPPAGSKPVASSSPIQDRAKTSNNTQKTEATGEKRNYTTFLLASAMRSVFKVSVPKGDKNIDKFHLGKKEQQQPDTKELIRIAITKLDQNQEAVPKADFEIDSFLKDNKFTESKHSFIFYLAKKLEDSNKDLFAALPVGFKKHAIKAQLQLISQQLTKLEESREIKSAFNGDKVISLFFFELDALSSEVRTEKKEASGAKSLAKSRKTDVERFEDSLNESIKFPITQVQAQISQIDSTRSIAGPLRNPSAVAIDSSLGYKIKNPSEKQRIALESLDRKIRKKTKDSIGANIKVRLQTGEGKSFLANEIKEKYGHGKDAKSVKKFDLTKDEETFKSELDGLVAQDSLMNHIIIFDEEYYFSEHFANYFKSKQTDHKETDHKDPGVAEEPLTEAEVLRKTFKIKDELRKKGATIVSFGASESPKRIEKEIEQLQKKLTDLNSHYPGDDETSKNSPTKAQRDLQEKIALKQKDLKTQEKNKEAANQLIRSAEEPSRQDQSSQSANSTLTFIEPTQTKDLPSDNSSETLKKVAETLQQTGGGSQPMNLQYILPDLDLNLQYSESGFLDTQTTKAFAKVYESVLKTSPGEKSDSNPVFVIAPCKGEVGATGSVVFYVGEKPAEPGILTPKFEIKAHFCSSQDQLDKFITDQKSKKEGILRDTGKSDSVEPKIFSFFDKNNSIGGDYSNQSKAVTHQIIHLQDLDKISYDRLSQYSGRARSKTNNGQNFSQNFIVETQPQPEQSFEQKKEALITKITKKTQEKDQGFETEYEFSKLRRAEEELKKITDDVSRTVYPTTQTSGAQTSEAQDSELLKKAKLLLQASQKLERTKKDAQSDLSPLNSKKIEILKEAISQQSLQSKQAANPPQSLQSKLKDVLTYDQIEETRNLKSATEEGLGSKSEKEKIEVLARFMEKAESTIKKLDQDSKFYKEIEDAKVEIKGFSDEERARANMLSEEGAKLTSEERAKKAEEAAAKERQARQEAEAKAKTAAEALAEAAEALVAERAREAAEREAAAALAEAQAKLKGELDAAVQAKTEAEAQARIQGESAAAKTAEAAALAVALQAQVTTAEARAAAERERAAAALEEAAQAAIQVAAAAAKTAEAEAQVEALQSQVTTAEAQAKTTEAAERERAALAAEKAKLQEELAAERERAAAAERERAAAERDRAAAREAAEREAAAARETQAGLEGELAAARVEAEARAAAAERALAAERAGLERQLAEALAKTEAEARAKTAEAEARAAAEERARAAAEREAAAVRAAAEQANTTEAAERERAAAAEREAAAAALAEAQAASEKQAREAAERAAAAAREASERAIAAEAELAKVQGESAAAKTAEAPPPTAAALLPASAPPPSNTPTNPSAETLTTYSEEQPLIENLGRYFKVEEARVVEETPENPDPTSNQLFRPLSIASQSSHDIRTNHEGAEKIHETFNEVVLEAARGSGLIANEKSKLSEEEIEKLVAIMLIALKNKGIGNPKDELGAQELFIKDYRKIYPSEDYRDPDEILVKNAKKFSFLFQEKMKSQNVRSGREVGLFLSKNEDENKSEIVGARLSRLATPENLMFFLEQNLNQNLEESVEETSKEKNVEMLVDLASKLRAGEKTIGRRSRGDNLKFASDEKWKKYAKEKNWKSLETKEDKKTKNTEKVKISDLITKLHNGSQASRGR